jgi:polysaccharide deacetylase 2 family uncharacterized protein YibQ
MSTEKTMASSVPNSWAYLLLGYVTVVVAGVLAMLMLLNYQRNLPLNLVAHTDNLTDRVVEALRNNRVPADQIVVSEAIENETHTAVWHQYQIVANLPGNVSAAGLAEVLRRNMESRPNVQLYSQDRQSRTLGLMFGNQDFATIELRGGRVVAREVRDMRPATERVASEAERILRAALPEGGTLQLGVPMMREDGPVRWSFTRIELGLPAMASNVDIASALQGGMDGREVTVQGVMNEDSIVPLVRLTYLGHDCVDVSVAYTESPLPPVELPTLQLPRAAPPMTPGTFSQELPNINGGDAGEEDLAPMELPLESDGLESSLLDPLNGDPLPGDDKAVRLAIIVDDGGYNQDLSRGFLALDRGLTFAILPFTPWASWTARQARDLGFEVMLHMPMESNNANETHPGMIMTAMSATEITNGTIDALATVPGAVGINNHVGSRFTETATALEPVLTVLKERGLYFVDSRTSAGSTAPESAQEAGVPVAVRDVFLDNEKDFDAIEAQFNILIAKARSRGHAIGICHFRPDTLKALAQLLPRLAEEGLSLVHASELVQ